METVEQEAPRTAESSEVRTALGAFATESLLLVRPDGEVVSLGGTGDPLMGYPDDQQVGQHVTTRLHPDDLDGALDVLARVQDGDTDVEDRLVVRARHADGHWLPLGVEIFDRRDDPVLRGLVLRLRIADAAEQPVVAVEADRARPVVASPEHEHLRSLAEVVPTGVLAADALGQVVFANVAAEEVFDAPTNRLVGAGWSELVDPQDRPTVAEASGSVLRTSHREQVGFRLHAHGGTRWVHATFVPLRTDAGSSGWIATVEDVTERRQAEADLAHRATHDALTGLPNRMLVLDRLTQASARLERSAGSLAVLFVDLDGFKAVNDRHGHHVGDRLLVETGRRLRMVTRPADTVGRLGGDEFVALCEATDLDQGRELADRIAEVVQVPLLVDGRTVSVGVSVGVWCTDDPSLGAEDLLARADRDMYRKKRASA